MTDALATAYSIFDSLSADPAIQFHGDFSHSMKMKTIFNVPHIPHIENMNENNLTRSHFNHSSIFVRNFSPQHSTLLFAEVILAQFRL